MTQFADQLEAVILTYIASQALSTKDKETLVELFQGIDTDNDGVITKSEFIECAQRSKICNEAQITSLVAGIDTNSSGAIDYTQFLAAALNYTNIDLRTYFERAFNYFDIDHSGYISYEEVEYFLSKKLEDEESIKHIFKEVDENGDGEISKIEFIELLMQRFA